MIVMIDVHCHMMPFVDDGPKYQHSSIQMAMDLAEMGFTKVCLTPHIPWRGKRLTKTEIERQVETLSCSFIQHNIPIELIGAAEHFFSCVPDLLQQEGLVCYPRGDTFLMEFSHLGFPPLLDEFIFLCQIKKKKPVIAHVERYPDVQRNPNVLKRLRERGCFFLVNLTSLSGAFGTESQEAAIRLLEESSFVDAVCTDLHSKEEIKWVQNGLDRLNRLVGEDKAQSMLREFPLKIISGEQPIDLK